MLTYSKRMSAHSDALIHERMTFIDAIRSYVSDQCEALSFERDHVELFYKPDIELVEDFYNVALDSIEKDLILQRTSRGPHRDDLYFEIDEHVLKRFGSQGQMKTYLVALHLALHEFVAEKTGKVPVILLDDIFDKLDDNRTFRLVSALEKIDQGQIFITDARHERVAAICEELEQNPVLILIGEDQKQERINTVSRDEQK